MKWEILAKYPKPGPTFYKIELRLLEQLYPYYRVLGQAMVEARVNGIGTCCAHVLIKEYGQCGVHTLGLTRHWRSYRAQTWEAKSWCERLLKDPPRYFTETWDSSTETLNGVCKEQMELVRQGITTPTS